MALPKVAAKEIDLANDVFPFARMADAEAAMTAHIVFEAWDPDRPAPCSAFVIEEIIRKRIGLASSGAPPQWLSTHPANETRQQDLAQYAARVMPLYEQASQHVKPVK